MTTIYYNGANPFQNVSPTPNVGCSTNRIHYNNYWGSVNTFHLIGQITGCAGGFADFADKQNTIISGFSQDFKPLVISDGTGQPPVFSGNYCIIKNISFPQSRYIGIAPYDIEIDVYDSVNFSGIFGVLDPSEEIRFEEQEDQTLNITHSISARGFNNSSVAIENAKQFAFSRSGWSNSITPLLISNCQNNFPCLQSLQENFDRLSSTYSLVENYTSDLANSGSGILRYNIDLASGFEQGINQVTINGTINLCKDSSIKHLRNRYNQINLYNLASQVYSGATNLNDLNKVPLSSGVTENAAEKTLQFNAVFDNNPQPLVYVDYTTNINFDRVTEITTVSLSAEIAGRGDIKTRWTNVLNYFQNTFDGYALALADYNAAQGNLIPSASFFPLNPNPNTQSQSFDEFGGKINYSAQWTNKLQIPYPFQDWNYSIDVKPSIRQYSIKPSVTQNGYFTIFDLNFANLEDVDIKGNMTVLRSDNLTDGIAAAQGIVNSIINRYTSNGNVHIFQNSLTQGDPNNRFIAFNVKTKGDPLFGGIDAF